MNDLEKQLVKRWEELLRIDGVGTFDNFFELGGHSLVVKQLISRMREAFKVEVPLHSSLRRLPLGLSAQCLPKPAPRSESAGIQKVRRNRTAQPMAQVDELSDAEVGLLRRRLVLEIRTPDQNDFI